MRYVNKSELDNYEFGMAIKEVEYKGKVVVLWHADLDEIIMGNLLITDPSEVGYWIYLASDGTIIMENLKTEDLIEAVRAFNDVMTMVKM